MARLPTVGGDADNWGAVLNEYLETAHNADGTLKLDVKTLADLKAIDVTTLTDKQQALVAGYSAPGDGGGGQFYYDAAATDADNGGTTLQLGSGAGRWKRIYSGPLSVKCFGARGDGVANDTAAFASAIAAVDDISIPSGTYLVDSITINRNVTMRGTGRKTAKIVVQSYTTYQTIKCGVLCRGAANSPSLADLTQISGIDIEVTSNEAELVGVLVTRKLNLCDSYIHGAPGDGVYFRSVNASNEAPYFCQFDSVWMKNNGGNGCTITENCNAIQFMNCQWSSNAGHGLHQISTGNGQPPAVYNTILIGGQAAYNQLHGIYIESGSNTQVYGTYAEYNSGLDGGNPKTGAYKNVQLGTNVTRSHVVLGEQGTDTDLSSCVGLNTVTGNNVSVGGSTLTAYSSIALGYQGVGTGRTLTFNGGGACEHHLGFKEGSADIFRVRYNGAPASPQNELLFESYLSPSWTEIIKMTNNGRLSFFGGATQTKQSVTGSRGGNAALSSLIAALANLGLISDNTT